MSTKLYNISDWCKRGPEVKKYPYIGEVDIKAEIGVLIKVDDKIYFPGVTGESYAGVHPVKLRPNPDSKKYAHNITCPFCGCENRNSWEADDSDDNYECGQCMAIFEYERVVTAEYFSKPKFEPTAATAKWVEESEGR